MELVFLGCVKLGGAHGGRDDASFVGKGVGGSGQQGITTTQ
jgi:hypothetical protein